MVLILMIATAIMDYSGDLFADSIKGDTVSTIRIEDVMERIEKIKQKYIGKPAPAVATMTTHNEDWSLADQKGKIVIFDFWATWCKGCVQSMPELERLHEKYKQNKEVLFVGVALDKDRRDVVEYCKKNNIKWLQLFEPGKGFENSCAKAFNVRGIPQVCIVDQHGMVAGVFIQVPQVEDIIERLLHP